MEIPRRVHEVELNEPPIPDVLRRVREHHLRTLHRLARQNGKTPNLDPDRVFVPPDDLQAYLTHRYCS